MRIMTVVGTRPEIIRISSVLALMSETPGIDSVLVHTGQNYDPQLSDVFFTDLGLEKPNRYLDVDTSSLGTTIGGIIAQTENAIRDIQPDAFLVLGDTNSALSLIMAKRMQVPTYHMEAGNRSFDANVPEETNRRIVDHTADFNLAYTEHARRNLLAEGIEPRRVIVTGSPLREVLNTHADAIAGSNILSQLDITPGEYFLVSAHREENVDPPERLTELLSALNALADRFDRPVIVSTHPRTRNRMNELDNSEMNQRIRFFEPFGFLDYVKLQEDARCVLSDSGTIAEESSMLGFPAVTLRGAIERPEALDTGSITMVDLEPTRVIEGVEWALGRSGDIEVPNDYAITNTSKRVINFILSTAPEHRRWSGLR